MHIKKSVHIKECAHIKELSIKDSQSIYSAPKKIYKLRSKISSFSNAEKYLNKKNNEEILRSSIDQGKIFGKIRTHKLLDEIFSSNSGRIAAHSVGVSTRFKVEKIYLNK